MSLANATWSIVTLEIENGNESCNIPFIEGFLTLYFISLIGGTRTTIILCNKFLILLLAY